MMFNRKMVVLCLAMFLVMGGTLMASGPWVEGIDEEGELTIPMGNLSVSTPSDAELTLPDSLFPHSRHMTYACATCHHKWDYTEYLQSCTASSCHDLGKQPEKSVEDGQYTEESIRYYKYAYHQMCRGCHRDINAQNREINKELLAGGNMELKRNGPVSCKGCHQEEEE
jgi:hypothetical protein